MGVSSSNRKLWVDALKGVGLTTVIMLHIGVSPPGLGLIRMPLFLFVAGFLFNIDPNWKNYLFKKTVHLIVPYVCFLFIVYVPQAIYLVNSGKDSVIQVIARPLLGGVFLFGWSGVFWFVTCLFFVQQCMNYLLRKFSISVVTAIMVMFLVISYINQLLFPSFWLPWSLQNVFAAAPIFFTGYLFKRYNFNLRGFEYLLTIGVVLFSINFPENIYAIKNNIYGIPFATFISAIICIITLVSIFRLLEKNKVTAVIFQPFSVLSKSSMITLYLHQPLQISLSDVILNPYIRLVVVLLTCTGFYFIINRFSICRALLLGSVKDFEKIFLKKQQMPKHEVL